MSYEDLMARIAREIPELAGKLSAPRVTYVKSSRKTYISFNSSVLAGEKQFLKLEAILREMFPGRPLAVRVTSPALKTAFLEDPAPYRQVLDDFLRRNYPMAKAWIGQIGWQIEKNQLGSGAAPVGEHEEDGLLTLVFPDEISLRVMNQSNVGPRLAMAIREIFAVKVRVEMTVEGTREERLRKMMEQRRDTALTVTAEEMAERYGTGVPVEGAEKAEKKPRKKIPGACGRTEPREQRRREE
jgi:DNA polymerase-3 subunit alpha (Gram-positive type)